MSVSSLAMFLTLGVRTIILLTVSGQISHGSYNLDYRVRVYIVCLTQQQFSLNQRSLNIHGNTICNRFVYQNLNMNLKIQ